MKEKMKTLHNNVPVNSPAKYVKNKFFFLYKWFVIKNAKVNAGLKCALIFHQKGKFQ